MNPERNNQIRREYTQGTPIKEIAQKHHVSITLIYNLTQGLPRRNPNQPRETKTYPYQQYPTLNNYMTANDLTFDQAIRQILNDHGYKPPTLTDP